MGSCQWGVVGDMKCLTVLVRDSIDEDRPLIVSSRVVPTVDSLLLAVDGGGTNGVPESWPIPSGSDAVAHVTQVSPRNVNKSYQYTKCKSGVKLAKSED